MSQFVEWGRLLDARKTADQSSTSTALVNVTDMVFPVETGKAYTFDFFVGFQTAATTTGLGLAVTAPAGLIAYEASIPLAADGTGGVFHGHGTSSGDLILSTGVQAANTVYVARLYGLCRPTANGNVQLQFRSEVNGSAVTAKQGSGGILTWG